MSEVEFYIIVGGILFSAAYFFGLWTEERSRQKRHAAHKQRVFEMALSIGGMSDERIKEMRALRAGIKRDRHKLTRIL